MRNRSKTKNTCSTQPSLLGLCFSGDFSASSPTVAQGDGEWWLQPVCHTLFAAPSSPQAGLLTLLYPSRRLSAVLGVDILCSFSGSCNDRHTSWHSVSFFLYSDHWYIQRRQVRIRADKSSYLKYLKFPYVNINFIKVYFKKIPLKY